MRLAECHPSRPHFAKGMCSPCYQREFRKTWKPKNRATCHPERALKCKGLCNACYQAYKASPEFKPTGRAKTKLICGHEGKPHVGHGLCGACSTRRRRDKDREADRRARKDYQLRATYGFSLHEFDAIYRAQGCACALCRKPIQKEAHRHVDHCHETGRVRGILCFACNRSLGILGDTPAALARALAYVCAEAGVFVPRAAA